MKNNAKGFYIVSAIISFIMCAAFVVTAVWLFKAGVELYISFTSPGESTGNTFGDAIVGMAKALLLIVAFGIMLAAIVVVVLAILQLTGGVFKAQVAANKNPKGKFKGKCITSIIFDFIFLLVAVIMISQPAQQIIENEDGSTTTTGISTDTRLFILGILIVLLVAVVFDILGLVMLSRRAKRLKEEANNSIPYDSNPPTPTRRGPINKHHEKEEDNDSTLPDTYTSTPPKKY